MAQRGASNGEGSLYQRASDGRWIGAVTIGYDARGRLRRKTVSGKTRVEAARKKRQLQHDLDSGLPPTDDRITITDYLERWLIEVIPHRVDPATVANYASLVRNHIEPALGRRRLSTLKPNDVQEFIHQKLEEDGLSVRTVRGLRGLLVQALNNAMRQGLIMRNVAALTDGPRQQTQASGRTLTIEQAQTLLDTVKGERLEALYVLMLATGMRPGEAFGLPWSNVDLRRAQITVSQALTRQPGGNVIGNGKTGRKGWRTVRLPPPAVAALRVHRTNQKRERQVAGRAWIDNGLVFCTPLGTPLDPDNHRRVFSNLTRKAGLGHWHPHELRHSTTSIMLALGVPIEVVSKILGHTSIRITADVYGHLLDQQHEEAAAAIGNALWP